MTSTFLDRAGFVRLPRRVVSSWGGRWRLYYCAYRLVLRYDPEYDDWAT